jgi:hypothetical protein
LFDFDRKDGGLAGVGVPIIIAEYAPRLCDCFKKGFGCHIDAVLNTTSFLTADLAQSNGHEQRGYQFRCVFAKRPSCWRYDARPQCIPEAALYRLCGDFSGQHFAECPKSE